MAQGSRKAERLTAESTRSVLRVTGHQEGAVHRDLQAENLLLDANTNIRLWLQQQIHFFTTSWTSSGVVSLMLPQDSSREEP